jgi:hypothetical protein
VLYSEVFSPDSKTTYFNRAVDRIRTDPRCVELLGEGKKIAAFGEETNNKWRRARPIAYVSLLQAGMPSLKGSELTDTTTARRFPRTATGMSI